MSGNIYMLNISKDETKTPCRLIKIHDAGYSNNNLEKMIEKNNYYAERLPYGETLETDRAYEAIKFYTSTNKTEYIATFLTDKIIV